MSAPRESEQIGDIISVREAGITVRKSAWLHGEGLSVVRFELSSSRGEAADVRLTEELPSDCADGEIGLHQRYGADCWSTVGGHRMVFLETLPPNADLVTLYGIRTNDPAELESFLSAPTLDVDPALEPADNQPIDQIMTDESEAAKLPDSDEQATDNRGDLDHVIPESDAGVLTPESDVDDCPPDGDRDGSTPDGDPDHSPPGRDLVAADDPTEKDHPFVDAVVRSTAAEPTGPDGVDAESAGTDADDPEAIDGERATEADPAVRPRDQTSVRSDDDDRPDDDRPDDGVLDALLAELDERALLPPEQTALREALGVEPKASFETRLGHVQKRVDDLSAYTEAMEDFIDVNGGAERVVEEFQRELDAMRETVTRVEATLGESERSVDRIENRVEDLVDTVVTEEELEAVEESVDRLSSDVTSVETEVDGVSTAVEACEKDVREVDRRVDAVRGDVDAVRGDVDAVRDDVDAVRDGIGTIRDEVDTVREDVDDATVGLGETDATLEVLAEDVTDLSDRFGGLSRDVDAVRAEMRTVQRWRENLMQAMQLPAAHADGGLEASNSDSAPDEPEAGTADY